MTNGSQTELSKHRELVSALRSSISSLESEATAAKARIALLLGKEKDAKEKVGDWVRAEREWEERERQLVEDGERDRRVAEKVRRISKVPRIES